MRVSIGTDAGHIPVISVAGEHLMFVDDYRAQEFVKEGKARLIRRRGRGGDVRVLQAVVEWQKPGEVDPLGRGTAFHWTHYSHKRETSENPPKVWTLLHLPDHTRPIFVRVLADCMA